MTARRLRSLFVMDPFKTVNIELDTTYRFMAEAQERGHRVLACRIDDLGARSRQGFAHAKHVDVRDAAARPFEILDRATVDFDSLDVIFMRKDPPFDIGYVFATYLLDAVDPARTLVVNRPSGLREANEKAFILRFPELTPVTVVTRTAADVHRFLAAEGGRCIIKPLDGAGGAGVLLLREGDPNLTSQIELVTHFGQRYVMLQTFVPEAKRGDKRIILLDGVPLGATLRVPAEGELRGNIHVGATCVKTELTPRDREICDVLGPVLRDLGLWFAGVDVLGDYLTEVNVTSPTGIQEINRLDGVRLERDVWDWVEERVPRT